MWGNAEVKYPQLGIFKLDLELLSSDYLGAIACEFAKILTIQLIQKHNVIATRSLISLNLNTP